MSDDWQKQVDWMRKNGVVSAKWMLSGFDGAEKLVLTECIAGAPAETETKPESAEDMKARHEREAKEQAEREDFLDFGAS